jgi:hypothetical protein
MAYIGCILFGLIFVLMSAISNGTLQERIDNTFGWIHGWAPFSYIIILLLVASPFAMVQIMNSWPKRQDPEDPMAKMRREVRNGPEEMED